MATISAVDLTLKTCLSESGYLFDASTSVWLPDTPPVSFPYSDSDAAEERLLKTVESSIDVRCGSSPLAAEIRDWTAEYHLSPVRTNLLRPVSHLLTGDTLEVGAGCGALSRYIGELNGRLLAVEGSLHRAKIAAARCQSLDNTEVVCASLESLQVERQFDTVLVVGVLEYCRLLGGEGDATGFLRRCRRFLKPGGHLIVAIENQLGLKYLCGAPEDHVGEPYFGLEDRYSDSTAITFGRSELAAALQSAGCSHIQELYPFPDYKLPQLILTKDALSYGPVLADLLSQYGLAIETDRSFRRSFSEAAAWRVVAQNKLVPDLSNSFLFIASQSASDEINGAFAYSSNRHRAFQCETRITKTSGEFKVAKTALYSDSRPASAKFKWCPSNSPFRDGRVYSSLLDEILLRPNWHYNDVVAWARPYFELLLTRVIRASEDGQQACLPGDQLDCGPHNLSLRSNGELEDFDFEWVSLHELPLGYVFFRSLVHCLTKLTAAAPSSSEDGILPMVRAVMSAFALRADDQAMEEFLQRESDLQSFVSGRAISHRLEAWQQLRLKKRQPSSSELMELGAELRRLHENLVTEKALTKDLELTIQHLQSALADEEKIHAAEQQLLTEKRIRMGLERSLSWRVTKPLRNAGALLRAMSPRFARRPSA